MVHMEHLTGVFKLLFPTLIFSHLAYTFINSDLKFKQTMEVITLTIGQQRISAIKLVSVSLVQ